MKPPAALTSARLDGACDKGRPRTASPNKYPAPQRAPVFRLGKGDIILDMPTQLAPYPDSGA
jgi:hypothetical protein